MQSMLAFFKANGALSRLITSAQLPEQQQSKEVGDKKRVATGGGNEAKTATQGLKWPGTTLRDFGIIDAMRTFLGVMLRSMQ